MAKVNKIYPSFYNGISQQIPELMTDTQCKDMVNCIPDIVTGVSKRPPSSYITKSETLPADSKIIHTYDRGEDNEEYIFVATGDATTPLSIYDTDGAVKTLDFGDDATTVKSYLDATDVTNLKALTVQDRTFIYNKEETVDITTLGVPIGGTTEYRKAVDISNTLIKSSFVSSVSAFQAVDGYVRVTLTYDGTPYTATSSRITQTPGSYVVFYKDVTSVVKSLTQTVLDTNLPATEIYNGDYIASATSMTATISLSISWIPYSSPYSGTLYSGSITIGDEVVADATGQNTAFYWIKRSSADTTNEFRYAVYLDGTTYSTVDDLSDTASSELLTAINASADFIAERVGNILKIYRTDGADFSFAWWDSWGSQASFGWKGEVSKLSDLPPYLGFPDEYVRVTGDDSDEFTDYWIKSTDTTWIETKDPSDLRGALTNMPIAIDRLADGTFLCSILDWEAPKVGDINTNPNPSFVGQEINSMFFYKNRLGIASRDNVVLSETGGYYNFYIKTVLDVIDSDPIDVAIASTTATYIHYAVPFQGSLFIFTKEGQFEMISQGTTSPTTVSIEAVSSYPMAINVEPKASGNSLFFISTTNNKQQLREYRKNNDTLNVTGIDLNLSTPSLIDDTVHNILINGVLGYVFVTTYTNEVYLYSYKDNSNERIQSAWTRWLFYEGHTGITDNSFEYRIINNKLIVVYKTATAYYYNTVDLTKDILLSPPLYPSNTLFPSDTLYPSGKSFEDTTDTVAYSYESKIELPDWYPKTNDAIATPKDKIMLKKITIEGEGRFDASVYRRDYNTTYSKTYDYTTIQDFDIHVNSKVGTMDIYISDDSTADFRIRSFIFEGLYSPTSKQIR